MLVGHQNSESLGLVRQDQHGFAFLYVKRTFDNKYVDILGAQYMKHIGPRRCDYLLKLNCFHDTLVRKVLKPAPTVIAA